MPATARGVLPVLQRIKSVSFAMYAEDVLMSHMRPQGAGFYGDVGAFHPQMHSNTYKLYLKGWSGLTIEPKVIFRWAAKRLRTASLPRRATLAAAIAEQQMDALLAATSGNLGLLGEQMDPDRGAMLGNMPQALSHLALVHAVLAVDEGVG